MLKHVAKLWNKQYTYWQLWCYTVLVTRSVILGLINAINGSSVYQRSAHTFTTAVDFNIMLSAGFTFTMASKRYLHISVSLYSVWRSYFPWAVLIIQHEQHEQTVKLHHTLQKTIEEATSKVSQPGKIDFLNFSHVDINAMVKAIFNEEANLQTANRINEVLL